MATVPATLVVLPGLDGTDVFFRPFLEAQPPSIQASFVDLPQDAAYRYEELLDVIRRRIADLPPFYVFASSFSGPLAIMLARAEPQKVRGLILAATFVRSPRPRLGWFRFATVTPVVWAVRAVRRLPVWLLKPRTDAIRRAKAETWTRVPARALAGRARAILGVDASEALRACVMPLLCITYEHDEVVSVVHADEIVRCHRSAERVTLPGSHLGMYEHPDRVAAEIVRFVDRVESARVR